MKLRMISTMLLVIFVLVFAIQNARTVEIRLLFWEFEFPRSLLLFLMLLVGMIIGWFGRSMLRISRS